LSKYFRLHIFWLQHWAMESIILHVLL